MAMGMSVQARVEALEREVRALKATMASVVPAVVDGVAGAWRQRGGDVARRSEMLSRSDVEASVVHALKSCGVLELIKAAQSPCIVGKARHEQDSAKTSRDEPRRFGDAAPNVVLDDDDDDRDDGTDANSTISSDGQTERYVHEAQYGSIHGKSTPSKPNGDADVSEGRVTEHRAQKSHRASLSALEVALIGEQTSHPQVTRVSSHALPIHVSIIGEPTLVQSPPNFELQTRDTVAVAWEKWCCGDQERGYPPLRTVQSRSISNKSVLRRFSDLRCVMQPIENLARERGMWQDKLTRDKASAIFTALQARLLFLADNESKRSRKKEIAWPTALNLLRRGKKRKQQEATAVTETVI